jgi:hypothetical protein
MYDAVQMHGYYVCRTQHRCRTQCKHPQNGSFASKILAAAWLATLYAARFAFDVQASPTSSSFKHTHQHPQQRTTTTNQPNHISPAYVSKAAGALLPVYISDD